MVYRERQRVEEGEDQAGTGRIYDAKIPLPYLELKCCEMLSLAATFYARRSTFCVLRLSVARCPSTLRPTALQSVQRSVRLTDRPSVRPSLCPTAVSFILPNTFLVVAFAKNFDKVSKINSDSPLRAPCWVRGTQHMARCLYPVKWQICCQGYIGKV